MRQNKTDTPQPPGPPGPSLPTQVTQICFIVRIKGLSSPPQRKSPSLIVRLFRRRGPSCAPSVSASCKSCFFVAPLPHSRSLLLRVILQPWWVRDTRLVLLSACFNEPGTLCREEGPAGCRHHPPPPSNTSQHPPSLSLLLHKDPALGRMDTFTSCEVFRVIKRLPVRKWCQKMSYCLWSLTSVNKINLN